MQITLTATHGSHVGPQVELSPGQVVGVGRDPAAAELSVPGDPFLSRRHFEVGCGERECLLRNLGRNGVTVSGRPIQEGSLGDADVIAAGQSFFIVKVLAGPLVEVLRGQAAPLYALMDAARSPDVLNALAAAGLPSVSLYDGEHARSMAWVAPYLVTLPKAATYLPWLATVGWGKSWGTYCTSQLPPDRLRAHFRRFLLVRDEQDGREMCFRFYDPRVMRTFLPATTPREAAAFFAGVSSFLVEGEDPGTLLRFTLNGQEVVQESVAVTA